MQVQTRNNIPKLLSQFLNKIDAWILIWYLFVNALLWIEKYST